MQYSREQLIDRIRQTARSIGFPEQVAIVQLARESANFADRYVYGPGTGSSGEKGLAQFMPGTWARFGAGMHQNAYDPDASLQAWANYINYLRRLFGDNWTKVLQGYNGGEGNVQRGTVSSAARRYASEVLSQAGTSTGFRDGGIAPGEGRTNWLLIGGVALLAVVVLLTDD